MKLIDKYQGEDLYKESEILIQEYKIRSLKESIEHQELITLYRQFIRACKELSMDIIIKNNSLSLAIFTEYLMQMGYFSYNNNLIKGFTKGKDKELYSNLGLSVVLGNAVCRHFSSFTTDLFKSHDIFCEDFSVLQSDKSMKENLCEDENHIANLIKYNGVYYVYDTYNHAFFEFRTPIELIEKSTDKNKSFLYYRPKYQIVCDKINLESLEKRLKEFKNSSSSNKISLKELSEIEKETTDNILSKAKLIRDFKEGTKDVKKQIHTLSKRIK